ncbi:MAG: response regulator transcription factor [Muribaculaceae bacterium]|nr:response regulator transcription factor [Muribaculaceae bacterium]
MAGTKISRIIIAENSPIIAGGINNALTKITGLRPKINEVTNKASLLDIVSSEEIDILIANPTFGGLLHPDEIRKNSLNSKIRIIAIELSKLSPQTLSLYEDHIHVTDDISTLSDKILPPEILKNNTQEEKETLSAREKEIVSLVVKGFTNQEIADKLYLSIHTVITHRRNIAKKLEIHSATGLTIYAIVNKIVDLSEIKI